MNRRHAHVHVGWCVGERGYKGCDESKSKKGMAGSSSPKQQSNMNVTVRKFPRSEGDCFILQCVFLRSLVLYKSGVMMPLLSSASESQTHSEQRPYPFHELLERGRIPLAQGNGKQ